MKTVCQKCNRTIRNNNYKRHFETCDGTYFTGAVNPNKKLSKKTKEQIYEERVANAAKAREHLINKPAWNKGTSHYSDDEVFCCNGKGNIKARYLEKVEYKCSCCNISMWNNNPITLELDHINGNNQDHRLENLRLLCPNCHSQTPTYKNKNNLKKGIMKVDDNTLLEALKTQANVRQALLSVGLQAQGANYKRVDNLIKKFKLTLSW
jgi:Zn finger protein HypA/HybF involved in hydrogenase expression